MFIEKKLIFNRRKSSNLLLLLDVFLLALILSLVGSRAANAQDELLFESGPPDSPYGLRISDITPIASADDFITTDDWTIGYAEFWTDEMPDMFAWDGTIKYYIFENGDGVPTGAPIYQGDGKSITKTPDSDVNTIYLGFKYTFEFQEPLELSANTIYWLALSIGGGGTLDTTQAFWHATTNRVLSNAVISGDLINWSQYYFNLAFRLYSVSEKPISVLIDIMPSTETNIINLNNKGSIQVAILSTDEFHVFNEVNPDSVVFGPAPAEVTRYKVKDINRDGIPDMSFYFKLKETGIECDDAEATLLGETYDLIAFEGTDLIETKGCGH